MSSPTVWLSNEAIGEMAVEAANADPDETGGMLLGWDDPDRNEVVVIAIIGPGPGGEHTPTGFRPDGHWQQHELESRYEQSGGVITYLGDWHVHPDGGFGMSRRDRRTMAKIAAHPDSRCSSPLMALLARDDDTYRLGVWVYKRSRLPPIVKVTQLKVRTWRDTSMLP